MIKLIFIISVFYSLNSFSKEECHSSKSFNNCYQSYQKKYTDKCIDQYISFSSEEITSTKEITITKTKYNIIEHKIKNTKNKNWFNLCFYPIQYFKMICRKKVCGYYNIK